MFVVKMKDMGTQRLLNTGEVADLLAITSRQASRIVRPQDSDSGSSCGGSDACTTVCTRSSDEASRDLTQRAAALAGLSEQDRVKLAQLLVDSANLAGSDRSQAATQIEGGNSCP